MSETYDIIHTVCLTEKATILGEKENKYVFRVNPKANKLQIKDAIEKLFKKTVVSVNTCNYAGKKRKRTVALGRTAHWKKAIVRLKKGEKIELA